jgi:hypothetical protein
MNDCLATSIVLGTGMSFAQMLDGLFNIIQLMMYGCFQHVLVFALIGSLNPLDSMKYSVESLICESLICSIIFQPLVPVHEARFVAQMTKNQYIEFKKRDHFMQDRFPELLDLLLQKTAESSSPVSE